MPAPVLFLLAHPDIAASHANRALADLAAATDNVITHELYSIYPDMFIDGAAERELLETVSSIVVQYPIYWYAAPGLLKEWFDRTLTAGWAYGRGGNALKGKKLMVSITTGSDEDDYTTSGRHGYPVEEYLKPVQQTAKFCKMVWQDPLVFHQARAAKGNELEEHLSEFKARLENLARGE